MFLIDLETGEKVDCFIDRVGGSDLMKIRRGKNYEFEWSKYKKQELYKLYTKDNAILGMMCVLDHPEEGHDFLEIVAIEVRADQRGASKKFDRIAGCLIGFAGQLSFLLGHDGYVSLTSKTVTANIYHRKYGFVFLGTMASLGPRMASDEENSQMLVNQYIVN